MSVVVRLKAVESSSSEFRASRIHPLITLARLAISSATPAQYLSSLFRLVIDGTNGGKGFSRSGESRPFRFFDFIPPPPSRPSHFNSSTIAALLCSRRKYRVGLSIGRCCESLLKLLVRLRPRDCREEGLFTLVSWRTLAFDPTFRLSSHCFSGERVDAESLGLKIWKRGLRLSRRRRLLLLFGRVSGV